MSRDRQSVTPRLGRTGPSTVARVKQLLVASALAAVLTGCSLSAGRDVRAYDTCLARHPGDAALCEGPRQAYQLDAATVQLGAGAINRQSGSSH